jgi:hypothetical protein
LRKNSKIGGWGFEGARLQPCRKAFENDARRRLKPRPCKAFEPLISAFFRKPFPRNGLRLE